MKIVLQKVESASVRVKGEIIAQIGKGYLLFVGIHKDDNESVLEKAAEKF